MPYEHVNSKGVKYFLHNRVTERGAKLFFFSKNAEDGAELPENMMVIEGPTGLPMVKKKPA